MSIKSILEKLSIYEDGDLTLEKAKEILEKEGFDADDVKEMTLTTMYNDYPCFGDGYTALIKAEDFQKFIKDTCEEFAQCLPDKFDGYFDTKAMYEDIVDRGWKAVLFQAQRYMEDLGRDITSVKKYDWSYSDCYLVELL